jgi:replicative DNA helicase
VTSSLEHSRLLLAAIIPDRRDLLDRALRDLTPEQIPDKILANLFTMLERFSEVTGSVLTRTALADILRDSRADAGTVAAYQETYDELHDLSADDATFKWSLEQIRELAADRDTNRALTEGMEILTRGVNGDKGEIIRGHHDARLHILTRFAEIDRNLSMQEAPEGDMREEGADILAEYAEKQAAREAGRGLGVNFGVTALDERLGGLHPGELILIVGYTSDGKTSACVQLAWSAAIEQGKNVVFLTTETVRNQVRRRIIARHSCLPVFGAGDGLNSRDIKDGTLSAEDHDRLHAVVGDFDANPGYGRLYICQVPRAATMGYVESKLLRIARQMPVDLVIMDYLALLKPDRKRTTDREELSGTLKAAKQISTTFNDGHGVPFVSPWQVSRTARAEAERLQHYTLNALSETAETSNSSDTIVSLLAPLDNESRRTKVKAQLMKHRDGEKANSIELSVDYATSKFSGPHQSGTQIDQMFDPYASLQSFI